MSEKIVQLNEEVIKGQIKELVRGSVEETLNELLEKEAESLTQAARYERSEARQGYRSGHYDRNLTTTSGDVTLHMPRLKGVSFETAIIERYRRRESSVEEACALSCWATGTYGIKTLQAVYHQSLLAMSNYRLENSTCRYPYKHMEYSKAGLQRHADDNGFHNTALFVDIPVITGLKIQGLK